MSESEQNQIVLSSAGSLLVVLAAVLGLPSLGAAAGAADVAQAIRSRRETRKITRLQNVVDNLNQRVADVERTLEDKEIDLFIEVVERAVLDDEAGKDIYYGAVLEWITRERPTQAQVRVLSSAVSQLSAIELVYFIHDMNGRRAHQVIDRQLPEETALARLQAFGLATGGVRMNGNPTTLGLVLKKYVPPNIANS